MNTATRHHLEKFEDNVRDNQDRRKKVTKAVFSYFAPNGDEYRRAFTAPPHTPEQEMWNLAPKQISL